jgi:hypothetical protein
MTSRSLSFPTSHLIFFCQSTRCGLEWTIWFLWKFSNPIEGAHSSNFNYFLIAKKWKRKKEKVKQGANVTSPFRPKQPNHFTPFIIERIDKIAHLLHIKDPRSYSTASLFPRSPPVAPAARSLSLSFSSPLLPQNRCAWSSYKPATFLTPQIEQPAPPPFSHTHRRSALVLPFRLPTQIRTPATKLCPVFPVSSLSLPSSRTRRRWCDDGDDVLEDPTGEPTRRRCLPLLRPLPTDSLRSPAQVISPPPDLLAALVLFPTDLMCLLWCPAGKEEEAKDVALKFEHPRHGSLGFLRRRVRALLSLSSRRGAGALVSSWWLDSLSMI